MGAVAILLLLFLPLLSGQTKLQEFNQAGACARCHVVSVMEWSLSKHEKVSTGCKACHGESQGHVIDERNNVKPERIPRGAAVATLCTTCHKQGCPKTSEKAACGSCHHAHALLNPTKSKSVQDEQLTRESTKWEARSRSMAEGEKLVVQGSWKAAAAAFRRVLEQYPNDPRAVARIRMCERRLLGGLPGFERTNGEFDAESGLPRTGVVAGIGIEMRLAPGGTFEMGSDTLQYAPARAHCLG